MEFPDSWNKNEMRISHKLELKQIFNRYISPLL